MARKTYRERYLDLYNKLQKELQKPFYSQTKISLPKRIYQKEYKRLQSIAKQIRKIGKEIDALQREGYEFTSGTIELPKILTRGTIKGLKKRTQSTQLKKGGKRFNLLDEKDFEIFKTTLGRPPQLTPIDDKNPFKTRSELDDWRDLKRILRRTPTKEEYEAYMSPSTSEEDYEIDIETGELIRKGTKRGGFFDDNEFGVQQGEAGGEPSQADMSYDSINKILDLLDSFDSTQLGDVSPMTKGNRYELVQSLKNDIETLLDTGDRERIADNIERNWEEISDLIDNIMYRTYADGVGSFNTRYDPVPDYNRIWSILNE